MRKTIQGQIYPNQTTRKILEVISRGCQKVYNHFVGKRKKCDKKKQKQPSKYEQKRQLKKFKDDNPKLKRIQSQILQEIQGAKVKQSKRELKIPLKLNQPLQGEIKTLTISWKKKPKMPLSEVKRAMGGDRGSINIVANNEGDKTKLSKNHNKAKKKLVKECQRLTNRVKDRNHKITRRIVDKNDLIVYEDLKLKKMKEKKKQGKKRKISKYSVKGLQEKEYNFEKWEHGWSLPVKPSETSTSNSKELSRGSSYRKENIEATRIRTIAEPIRNPDRAPQRDALAAVANAIFSRIDDIDDEIDVRTIRNNIAGNLNLPETNSGEVTAKLDALVDLRDNHGNTGTLYTAAYGRGETTRDEITAKVTALTALRDGEATDANTHAA
ncbi:18527_t:CDS:2 [Funneliformis geosporum]|uniref:18527_t:CDS:1 n=1 Tax=Funneliformis geosporum TaxID=1117311 RepID=A0A9W4T8F3_9GLOM|nr:18527_t:CDS:2 [Funneliformis geosporum]